MNLFLGLFLYVNVTTPVTGVLSIYASYEITGNTNLIETTFSSSDIQYRRISLCLYTVLLGSIQNLTRTGEIADQIRHLRLYAHVQTGHHIHIVIFHTYLCHRDKLFRHACEI